MKLCQFVLLGLVSIGTLGCGGGGASDKRLPTIPVSGKMTVDGKPVGGCAIVFTPIVDDSDPDKLLRKTAAGTVSTDGSFTLRTHGENDGAIPGKYSATIASDPSTMTMTAVPGVRPVDIEIKKPEDGSPLKLDVSFTGTGTTITGAGEPGQNATPP